jgi:hypothetical protein
MDARSSCLNHVKICDRLIDIIQVLPNMIASHQRDLGIIEKLNDWQSFGRCELKSEPISQDGVIDVIQASTLPEAFQEMGSTFIQKYWLIDHVVWKVLNHGKQPFAIFFHDICESYNSELVNILARLH